MKLLILTLALLSTTAQAAFISQLGGVDVTLSDGLFRSRLDTTAQAVHTITGVVEIPADTHYLFAWDPLNNTGSLDFSLNGPSPRHYAIGNTGEVIEGFIDPGVYDFEIIATGGKAGFFNWTLITNGVPESGPLMAGWIALLGAMILFRHDAKRS